MVLIKETRIELATAPSCSAFGFSSSLGLQPREDECKTEIRPRSDPPRGGVGD
jgi:hypothetical protein